MEFYQLFGQREADAGTFTYIFMAPYPVSGLTIPVSGLTIDPVKPLEYMGQLILRDANTGVFYGYFHPAVSVIVSGGKGLYRNGDLPAGGGIIKGVG